MPADQDSTLATSPEPPLTTGDVAKHFGVNRNTVRRWANEGLIEFFTTPSGHRRFHLEDIERFTTARLSA